MSRDIYALLVGIDRYQSEDIPPLSGCVNDITAIDEFLVKRGRTNQDNLHIKKLTNEQATRQSIINGFRNHLCLAQGDDTVLFYFSGHGSQEKAAPEFWHVEPDHLNETLVCWDSRVNHVWDLADKEIAKLIAEVAQNHPHIVVILDCCHSGGGTRSEYTGVREVGVNLNQRPLEDFIFSPTEISNFYSHHRDNQFFRFNLPKAEYILLAACRDSEEAREHYSQLRGVFSYFLLDTLYRNDTLTYRDLFKRTNVFVRSFFPNQSPQIEATNPNYLDQRFLGGTINKRQSYFTVTYDDKYGWNIDGGAVHGIIAGFGNERTRIAIFPIAVENLQQLENAIAVAEISRVFPQLSQINISGEKEDLNPELIYKAVIIHIPLSYLKVYLEGYESGISFARRAMQEAFCSERPSLYLCEVSDITTADFCLRAFDSQYIIIRTSDNRKLIQQVPEFNLPTASQVIQTLEHIARWTNVAKIMSPVNSSLPSNAVKMQVFHNNIQVQDYQINLEFNRKEGDENNKGDIYELDRWNPPTIAIKLINTSNIPLYCVLLNLTELFAINIIPFTGGQTGIWLEPGQETFACEGKQIAISIPNLNHQQIKQYQDILKLIVSTREFDGSLFQQDNIETYVNRTSKKNQNYNNIDKIIRQTTTRAIVPYIPEIQEPEKWDDWVTTEILITTTIPQKINNSTSTIHHQPTPIKPNISHKYNNLLTLISLSTIKAKITLGLTFIAILIITLWTIYQNPQQQKQIKPITLSPPPSPFSSLPFSNSAHSASVQSVIKIKT